MLILVAILCANSWCRAVRAIFGGDCINSLRIRTRVRVTVMMLMITTNNNDDDNNNDGDNSDKKQGVKAESGRDIIKIYLLLATN